ncbi:MAG TPA: hypothetical protein EYP36_07020 [Calditrichaeota bacterium]|nr:hypothetical protein [Calditrichota bacterium]
MMTQRNVKDQLLRCLEGPGSEYEIISCFECVAEELEKSFTNSRSRVLNRQALIRIKSAIKKNAKKEKYDLGMIFRKLWWSRKPLLNNIAAHLLPEVYKENDTISLENIKMLLWRVDSRSLCAELVYSLKKPVREHIEIWKGAFWEWAKSDFKWNRLIGIMLINETAKALTLQIPQLLDIVDLYMQENNSEIQEEVAKCLVTMTDRWDLTLLYYLERYHFSNNYNTQAIIQKYKLKLQ